MVDNTIGDIDVEVGADLRQFRRKLKQAEREARHFGRRAERHTNRATSASAAAGAAVGRLGPAFAGAAGGAATFGGAIAGLAIVGTVTAFAQFEAVMNQVRAVSGATRVEMEELTRTAEELGRTTRFSANQVGDAMSFMAMAGMETQQILGGIEQVLDLAAAGNMDLARSADIVTNIMTAMGVQATELTQATDVLTKTFTSTNTSLGNLGFAFKYVAPIASAAGVSIEETSAALGLLGNAGMQGTMAGTALRGALIRMLNPTGEAKDMLDELGITIQDSNGQMKDFSDILEQFEPHADNVQLFAQVFGQRAGPGMVNLVRQGTRAFRDLTHQLENAEGTTKRIADIQMEGLRGAFIEAKSAAEGLAIAIGDSGLGGAIEGLTDQITANMRAMTEWIKSWQDLEDQSVDAVRGVRDSLQDELDNLERRMDMTPMQRVGDSAVQIFVQAWNTGLLENLHTAQTAMQEFLRTVGSTLLDGLLAIRDTIAGVFEDAFGVTIIDQANTVRGQLQSELDRINEMIYRRTPTATRRVGLHPDLPDPELADRATPGQDDGSGGVDKRARALQELQRLQMQYLRQTGEVEAAIQMQHDQELARFKKMLEQKLISQEEYEQARQQLAELTEQELQNMQNTGVQMAENMAQSVSGQLEGAFRSFVENGKLDFQELTQSILSDIATIAFRMALLNPLMESFGFGGGAAGGGIGAAIMEQGGMVGKTTSPQRQVPEAIFANAPRLQGGGRIIGPGEVPAVLHPGERVIPANEVGRSEKPSVNIEIVNEAGGEVRQETRRRPNGDEVRRFVVEKQSEAIARGEQDGPMRSRFGSRPVGIRR